MNTTDNQKELFDLVNEEDEVIGTITRFQAHHNPNLFHRSIGVLVYNDQNQLFMQKRSSTKDMDPNLWSISSTGHVMSGQTYEDAAVRELEEELGVSGVLTYANKYIVADGTETEVQALYTVRHNGPFRLHPEEIARGEFFALSELESKIRTKHVQVTIGSLLVLHTVVGLMPERTDLLQFVSKRF